MAIPLLAAALPSIGKFLAGKGMNLLAGIFKGGAGRGVEKITEIIKEKTGINIADAAEEKYRQADSCPFRPEICL